jgi:hypothetical protein
LLPALAGAVALWSALDRVFSLAARGRAARGLGVVLAASLSSLTAAAWLLPRAMFGLPAASYRGAFHFAQSALELTVAVCVALGLSAWIVRCAPKRPEGEGESARHDAALGSRSIQR